MIFWNSLRTGSCISLATIFSVSFNGNPDLTPRTMRSTAFGNWSTNFCRRRFRARASMKRGSPRPAKIATPSVKIHDRPKSSATKTPRIAKATLIAAKCPTVNGSPACSSRRFKVSLPVCLSRSF